MGYVIQDAEAGNVICFCDTYEEAQEALSQYEEQDAVDGIFEEGFYEIVEK